MILTRIKRGAIRTQVLISKKLASIGTSQRIRPIRQVRTFALSALAAYTVILPVLALHPVSAAAMADASEPPSTQLISVVTTSSVEVSPTSKDLLKVSVQALQNIEISPSPATLREQEAARQAELARQAAEQKKRDDELALQRYYADQQQYVAQIASQSAATVSSGDEESVFNAIESRYGSAAVQYAKYIATGESGIRLNAVNGSSGACGMFQALPCSKMGGMDARHQADWVNQYVQRYGSWENAAAYWRVHRNW